jgi:hypothetical protein
MKHLSQTQATAYVLFFLSIGLVLLILPSHLLAAPTTYTPLVGIPGVQTTPGNLPAFLNKLYLLTISIGAIFATIKIVMAGVKWSLSDIVTDKSSAKQDIKGALFGLAILLVPFIVLSQIYPNLTSMNFLQSVPSVDLTVNSTASGIATGQTESDAVRENRRFCEQSRGVYDSASGSCSRPDDESYNTAENKRLCEQSGGSFDLTSGVCTGRDPETNTPHTVPAGSYTYATGAFGNEQLTGWITHCGGPTRIRVLNLGADGTFVSCQ